MLIETLVNLIKLKRIIGGKKGAKFGPEFAHMPSYLVETRKENNTQSNQISTEPDGAKETRHKSTYNLYKRRNRRWHQQSKEPLGIRGQKCNPILTIV